MPVSSRRPDSALTPKLAAPQHKPRPLPLFLELVRSETAGQPARLARALEGLRRYQAAERGVPVTAPPPVAERLGACLRDYGGSGPPVLFVPSLINPPSILDLSEDASLLRWLAGRGRVRPLLLDWGWALDARKFLDVAGHVEEILLPLMAEIGESPVLAGYCLGGTMAFGAAARVPVKGVAAIAAPWRFRGFGDAARARLADLWGASRPTAERLGLLPMEILQSAFWALDPARTVAKFEAFAALEPDSAKARAFVALEDWANDGPALPLAAARELFEDFFGADRTGCGAWRPSDPASLGCPVLEVVSTVDRIVPAATAAGAGQRIELALGHVGMMVGSRAPDTLWTPLEDWLSRTAAR